MNTNFDIPVAVFMFKRIEKTVAIIEQIAKIKPKKIYLIADGARTASEQNAVLECRKEVEKNIVWDCEIIKNYSDHNRGVYLNIAGGAKWVFEREEFAIFLEDDNYPEISFFHFCKEMLEKYKNDTRIFWICGTNYLKEHETADGSSYVFTNHMMPCGWASWSNKFLKFYDGDLELFDNEIVVSKIKQTYMNKSLFKQDFLNWQNERKLIKKGIKPSSWDYQMSFSIRANNLLGIVPKFNQIRNIGVDNDSAHGGNSFNSIMVSRFCNLETKNLLFPLIHPKTCLVDVKFEDLTGKIICAPKILNLYHYIIDLIIRILQIKDKKSFKSKLRNLVSKVIYFLNFVPKKLYKNRKK